MPRNPPPMPTETPLVETDRTMNWFWVQFFVNQQQLLQQSATVVVDTSVSDQSAAIGATSIDIGSNAGLYRVNLVARITRAASVSSSLTPTFRWTMGGVALSRTYTALTGNTTSTYLVDVFPARLDASTALTYETAYASVGGTTMTYSLEISCERLA